MKFVSKTPVICAKCGDKAERNSNVQKYCDDCGDIRKKSYNKDAAAKKRGLKLSYTKSSKQNGFKDGIGIYRQLKDKKFCTKCKSQKNLLIHHKDEDRTNNHPSNLEVLCKRCHQVEHQCWSTLPKGEELSKLKKVQAAKAPRDKFGHFIKISKV